MSDPVITEPTPAPQTQPPVVVPSAAFTQEQLNAAIADEKRRWKKQQDEAAAEIKRKADEEAATAKGEFEKLASERGARLATVEAEHTSATERLEALSTAMETQIKARVKALPEELRDLLPEGDVLTRYEQLGKLEMAAAKLSAPAVPPKPPLNTPPGPRGPGNNAQAQQPDVVAQKRASGEYAI